MRTSKEVVTALGVALAIGNITRAFAESAPNNVEISGACVTARYPWADGLRERAYSNWVPSTGATDGVEVTVSYAKNGKLFDVQISNHGPDQVKADALQAVLSAAAYSTVTGVITSVGQIHIAFSSQRSGHPENGIKEYFDAHPDQHGKCIAFYRIPLDVLTRYPGLFEEKELVSMDNVSTIPESATTSANKLSLPLEQLRFIYSDCWVPFFIENPHATKEQILQFADWTRWMFQTSPS